MPQQGALGFLADTADRPLEDRHEKGYRAIEVDGSYEYLDGHRVQTGKVADRVPTMKEQVYLDGSTIEVEQETGSKLVASEWLADVQADGWILAERTYSSDEDYLPDWPFSYFGRTIGTEIRPMGIDVSAFVERQEEHGRSYEVEMTTTESMSDGVRVDWGRSASKQAATRANVGVALTTHWKSDFVRLVCYSSGYLAIWEPEQWSTEMVGRFVHEEIVPVAVELEDEEAADESETEQTEVSQHA